MKIKALTSIFVAIAIIVLSYSSSFSQDLMLTPRIPAQLSHSTSIKVDKKSSSTISMEDYGIQKSQLKSAQSDNLIYDWGRHLSTVYNDRYYDVVIDASGNIIVGGTKGISSSDLDAVIYKNDNSGNIIWSDVPAKSSDYDAIYGIATDKNSNIYVTGQFTSTAFDGRISSNGSSDIFLAKYDPAGNVVWAKAAGGYLEDYGCKIELDALGNIYLVGYFNGTAYWDNIERTSSSVGDIFIAKYNSSGNALWVRTGDIGEYNYLHGIGVDKSGNSYVSANFSGIINFEGAPTIGSNGGEDMFLIKYDASGNFKWQKTAGGIGDDGGNDTQVDSEGNILICGYFSDGAKFGNKTLTAHGSFDIFCAKYSTDGNIIWVKQFGGNGSQSAWSISSDEKNNCYITGWFSGTGAFDNTTIVSSGGSDTYAIKYDKYGNLIWVEQIAKGEEKQVGTGIFGKKNDIVISGYYEGEMTIYNSNFDNSGEEDAYRAKFKQLNNTQSVVYVNPSLSISVSQVKQNQTIVFSGVQFSPVGKVDLTYSGAGLINSVLDIPIEVNGSFQYSLTINSNQPFGDYSITATDNITGKSVARDFQVIPGQEVTEDFLKITAPSKPESKTVSDPIIIIWSDKANPSNNFKHSYSVQYQKNEGNWQTIQILEGEDNGYEFITLSAQFVPANTGVYKFKVTDNNNTSRSKISSAVTVTNSLQSDINIEFLWDKSFEQQLTIDAPIGVVADGVARFYIAISNASSLSSGIQKVRVSLSDPQGYMASQFLGKVKYCSTQNDKEFEMDGNNANSIEAENLSSNVEGKYWFWYVAPDDFSRNQGDWDKRERTITAIFQITLLNGNILDLIKKEINIARPPLMLVHGLNGDPKDTWGEFPTGKDNTLFISDPRFKIKKAIDIEPNSHFEINSNQLLGGIDKGNSFRSLINEMRKSGYACNQVDYVCHSMGGSVLRHAVDNEKNYKVKSNYNLGFVHKFITIHTPHDGSSFANLLYDLDKMGIKSGDMQRIASIFKLFKCGVLKCKVVDAVLDLRFKDGIKFSQTNVPSHLIGSSAPCSEFNWKANSLLTILKLYFFPPSSWFNGNCSLFTDYFSEKGYEKDFLNASDAIVSVSSQFSRENINFLPSWCSWIPGSMHNSMFGDSPTKSKEVGKEVDKLLNSNTKSNLFSYIPATNVPSATKSVKLPPENPFEIAENKIQILYPTENQEFFAGDSLTIKLQVDTVGLEGLVLYFQDKNIFSKPNNSIVEYKLYVSPEYVEGQYINIIGGYSISDTTYLSYTNLDIQVNPVGSILEFNIKPEVLMIEVGNSRRPDYEAIFENAIAQIGQTDLLNVVIKDPDIVAYDGFTNQFNGISKGSTNATVTYRGISKTVFFEVIQNEEPPNDAITDVMDFRINKNDEFYVTAYPNPFTNQITFEFTSTVESDFRLEIINIYGQNVKTYIFENRLIGHNSKTLDLSDLSDGIYMYRLQSRNDYQIGKIVKGTSKN